MPDYYWDQDNAVPVDYLCSQWFLRPEWLQYMWVSSVQEVVWSLLARLRSTTVLSGSEEEEVPAF